MKFLFKTFFLLIASLVLLVGCALSKQKPEITEEVEKIITCDDLKNQNNQEICKQEVNTVAINILFDEIVRLFDLKRCDELPVDTIDDCKQYLNESGVTNPISEDTAQVFDDILNEVYDNNYDITTCNALTDPDLRNYCIKRIKEFSDEEQFGQILESEDVTKCDELLTEDYQNSCKSNLEVVEEPIEELIEEPVDEGPNPQLGSPEERTEELPEAIPNPQSGPPAEPPEEPSDTIPNPQLGPPEGFAEEPIEE